MKSLPRDSQRHLSAAVIRRMGLTTPGQQSAAGDVFSTERFLTNWNNLSAEARGVLFSRMGPKFVNDMNAVAKVADNLRRGSKVFSNPSGTQPAVSAQVALSGAGFSAITGNVSTAAIILSGLGGAHALSRTVFTNPKVVRWLARSTKIPPAGYSAFVSAVSRDAQNTSDIELARFAVYLESVKERAEQPDERTGAESAQ